MVCTVSGPECVRCPLTHISHDISLYVTGGVISVTLGTAKNVFKVKVKVTVRPNAKFSFFLSFK